VVASNCLETTTQPPGILAWATLLLFSFNNDTTFLDTMYQAFAQNNEWYYAQRGQSDGLCIWSGEDSGLSCYQALSRKEEKISKNKKMGKRI
jgi:hypothetical protein